MATARSSGIRSAAELIAPLTTYRTAAVRSESAPRRWKASQWFAVPIRIARAPDTRTICDIGIPKLTSCAKLQHHFVRQTFGVRERGDLRQIGAGHARSRGDGYSRSRRGGDAPRLGAGRVRDGPAGGALQFVDLAIGAERFHGCGNHFRWRDVRPHNGRGAERVHNTADFVPLEKCHSGTSIKGGGGRWGKRLCVRRE